MMTMLDHPGLIQRSLMNTQIETKDGTYSTDVKKWGEFTKAYYRDTKEVNLLVSRGTSQSTRQVAKMSLTF